jgi:hypothetical protein
MRPVDAKAFKKMSIYKRLMCIRHHGEILAARKYMANDIYLYQVNDFFAEAWFRVGTDDLAAIELVDDAYQFTQYCDQIDISDLLS